MSIENMKTGDEKAPELEGYSPEEHEEATKEEIREAEVEVEREGIEAVEKLMKEGEESEQE